MVRNRSLERRQRRRRLRHVLATDALPPQRNWLEAWLWFPLLTLVICLLVLKQQSIAEIPQTLLPQFHAASLSWVPGELLAKAQPVPIQAVPLANQGNQIVLNGRSLPAIWSQRQTAIGIADSGLMQAFGVDLLSSSDILQQPVDWYSDPEVTPLDLSTWFTPQYRFLDLDPIAQRFGWEVSVQNRSLQINTPPARVSAVRQGLQPWGDRLVLELDQPAPIQVEEGSGQVTLTLDAQIDPAVVRSFRSRAGNHLRTVRVARLGNRTRLTLSYPSSVRSQVSTLPNPNRVLIDVRSDAMVERNIQWGPGLRWQQQYVNVGSSKFPVVSLELDLRQAGLSLKPIRSNTDSAIGTAPLINTAQNYQAAAAINAGFFNRNTQLPLGAIRKDGRWLSGPILDRGAIGWTEAGAVTVGRLAVQETLTTATGVRLPIVSLNSGFINAGVAHYTPDWGSRYTSIFDNEVLISLVDNQVVSQQRAATAGRTTIPIPANGSLLVVHADREAVAALPVGMTVEIERQTQPSDFDQTTQAIGAGPLLLQNQQIVLNARAEGFSAAFSQQQAPRSIIAVTPSGHLMLMAIHNRVNGLGPTLAEAARLTQQMGLMQALNLDGGSSTSLYLGGQLLDRPPSTAARVHNGIGVFLEPNR